MTNEISGPPSNRLPGTVATDDFANTIVAFAIGLCAIAGKVTEFLKAVEVPLMAVAQKFYQASELEKAGWLPHPGFPFDRFNAVLQDPDALKGALANYHTESWSDIRKALEQSLEARRIDEDARRLFRQALDAHAYGLYALVPRSLFPELERIWRVKFSEEPMSKATSHPRLMKALGEQLSLADAAPGGFSGLSLLGRLIDHVFQPVTQKNYADISADAVPNRHAALHGYCVYDNAQSSLNALIMADYMLLLFDQLDAPEFLSMVDSVAVDEHPSP